MMDAVGGIKPFTTVNDEATTFSLVAIAVVVDIRQEW